jgi:soluble lytic murein transglycosylase-like protein
MLPALKELAGVVKGVLADWAKILTNNQGGVLSQLGQAVTDFINRPLNSVKNALTPEARRRIAAGETSAVTLGAAPTSSAATVAPGPARPASAAADFARLEQKYGLPAGLLDRIWQRESNRGQNMLSPAGAKGHFQFMDATAAQYGVQDPNDLKQSSEGAARYMRDLLTMYGGDLRKATGAYNWGPGNMNRYGPANAPAETQAYMDAVGGPAQITSKTDIYIDGSGDPRAVGAEVERRQMAVNADLVRNIGGVVQ